ncbi:hypothetical protein [Lactiplantibacillus songbeiensis]|uniref:Uncharacterized protein n=1 Tax=Lactiplantibacillus songbeiensis TaxID=2559920 RepID=A0ABW4C4P8_9LACO|nr:hypothetical protein [Lactiplantibacillus songbeiensis]
MHRRIQIGSLIALMIILIFWITNIRIPADNLLLNGVFGLLLIGLAWMSYQLWHQH